MRDSILFGRKDSSFSARFNLSVVLPQLFASLVLNKVIANAADKAIVFELAGGCLAVSAVLWLLVREDQAKAVAGAPVAAH